MASSSNPMKLVTLAAKGLAELTDEDVRGSKLNLDLEVSVWLRRSGADLASVPRALLALRRTLLMVSALDPISEPVPLIIEDTQLAVANLCVYLHGLIGRGAASLGVTRVALVDAALAHLSEALADTRKTS
jgi:hypothetical protein